ncbi:hypothetical protein T484DRAFT_2939799 [Baffinella frigidus]|nr:hypothetical protein T484DRAFT_2939799 [Cryptophyta sp. CCMP2293]
MRPMLDTLIVNFTLMVEFLRVAPPAAATWKRWQIIDYIRRCANPHAVPPANISVASLLVLEESPTNSPRELGSLSELDSPEKQVEEETTNLDSEDLCLASPVSSLASPTSADRTFGDESSPIVPIERSTNQPKPSRKSKFFGSLTPLGEESVTESPHSFYETPVPHMVPNAPQEDTSRDETEVSPRTVADSGTCFRQPVRIQETVFGVTSRHAGSLPDEHHRAFPCIQSYLADNEAQPPRTLQ